MVSQYYKVQYKKNGIHFEILNITFSNINKLFVTLKCKMWGNKHAQLNI